MNKKYLVTLTDEERQRLQALVSQGHAAARRIPRAWILLKADASAGSGWPDEPIHQTCGVGLVTIYKEAKRLCDRLEFHPTPKHGSWLNMAATELSVLAGQGLDRRMDSKERVVSEVTPWEEERNRTAAKVRGRFTTEKARIKLEKLYPVLEYPEQPRA